METLPDNLTEMSALAIPASLDIAWAIEETTGNALLMRFQNCSLADYRAQNPNPALSLAEIQAAEKRRAHGDLPHVALHDANAEKPFLLTQDGIMVFHITGPMSKTVPWSSGGTSTVAVRRMVNNARLDPDVKGAFAIMDTPGGTVTGTDEAGQAFADFAAVKPLHVFGDGLLASAGIWVASQATSITAARATHIGSIGAVSLVPDLSRMATLQGVEMKRYRSRHPHSMKGVGAPGLPITTEEDAYFQSLIDGMTDAFVNAVATGRGMSASDVSQIADGRIHPAAVALQMGLIDAISTLPEAYDALVQSTHTNDRTKKKEPRMADNPEDAQTTSVIHRTLAALGFVSAAPPAQIAAPPANFAPLPTAAQTALLAIAATAGVTTPETFASLQAEAQDGKELRASLVEDVKKQAARCAAIDGVGDAKLPQMTAGLEHLPVALLIAKRDAYKNAANTAFGITETTGAQRASAGAELPDPLSGITPQPAGATAPAGTVSVAVHVGAGTPDATEAAFIAQGREYGKVLNGDKRHA